jgi:hypothetical protein
MASKWVGQQSNPKTFGNSTKPSSPVKQKDGA